MKICQAVVRYKLAEQILLDSKKIKAPSYYGIFKSVLLEFETVETTLDFQREDKQPDVIATTKDGSKYIIVFKISNEVIHNRSIVESGMNCLEIDISDKPLPELGNWLLNNDEDRQWISNDDYFKQVESLYKEVNKEVRIVSCDECNTCRLSRYDCCAHSKNGYPVVLKNNGKSYRLCKVELFNQRKNELGKGPINQSAPMEPLRSIRPNNELQSLYNELERSVIDIVRSVGFTVERWVTRPDTETVELYVCTPIYNGPLHIKRNSDSTYDILYSVSSNPYANTPLASNIPFVEIRKKLLLLGNSGTI